MTKNVEKISFEEANNFQNISKCSNNTSVKLMSQKNVRKRSEKFQKCQNVLQICRISRNVDRIRRKYMKNPDFKRRRRLRNDEIQKKNRMKFSNECNKLQTKNALKQKTLGKKR